MLNNPCLKKADIVIADRDWQMADVLRSVLRDLGFSGVSVARNGRRAVEILKERPIDMLITEWEMDGLDGIHLIKTLRRSENPYFALMPIIMLTGHAAAEDVMLARDMGVTEFLVKPYTTKTLFRHLEHIIDFPRHFIVSDNYIGPCRRRTKAATDKERRQQEPALAAPSKKITKQGAPVKLLPQKEIRRKIGLEDSLKDIITPQLLAEAQATISTFQDQSLQWIAEDMRQLEQAMLLVIGKQDTDAVETCKTHLLSIKSRAGTFGYDLPAKAAYDLYNFLRKQFEPGNMRHNLVLQKHIEVVKILLAKKVTGGGGSIEKKLLDGLAELMNMLGSTDEPAG